MKYPSALLLAALAAATAIGASREEPKKYNRTKAMNDYRRPEAFPFPEENRYTRQRAELGKMLFFDPRLSAAGTISCATCHRPESSWTDSRPTSVGAAGTPLKRRTPTILNSAWAEALFWDGRATTLEEQALGPIQAPPEMNMPLDKLIERLRQIAQYPKLFAQAYPGEPLTPELVGKAIATFERTVASAAAPFDEWIGGDETAISEPAKRGFDLFNTKAACAKCHSGWNFTDYSFHDLGMSGDDKGRGAILPKIEKAQFAFKTPTLRNAVQRAPYLHDGSAKTLEEVVDFYNKGPWKKRSSLAEEMKELNLSAEEKRDLLEFLQTLSSKDEPVHPPVLPN